jgi:aconitate decarboxylase
MMETSPTARLAEFVAALKHQNLPPEVVRHMKLCLLDTIGCGVYGSTLPWGGIIAEFVRSRGGLPEASVWGDAAKIPAEAAVLANGTFVHGFEMDDLHPRSILHPGSVTMPVVIALAEARGGISGRDALMAMIAGYEVGARVGMAVGAQHLRRGFHPTGTVGTFAAAAAASKALGLSAGLTVHALGIGGTQAGGLMAAQYSSMVKRMHAGRAGQSGVYGALLAERGFTGITDILEAQYGGFCTTYAEQPDMGSLTSGLGEIYETLNVGFKPYCCCGSNHTSLDGVKELLGRHNLMPGQIGQLRIYTTLATKMHVGWPYVPESITTAQMNLYYCVAALLADGKIFVDQFQQERLIDPVILNWIDKIEVIHDPELDAAGGDRASGRNCPYRCSKACLGKSPPAHDGRGYPAEICPAGRQSPAAGESGKAGRRYRQSGTVG